MFKGLKFKTKILIVPISVILAVTFAAIYMSFYKVIQEDYLNKSALFSKQLAQNTALQLDKIQNITETLIKSYSLDTILQSDASTNNINRCLEKFIMYDFSINVIILTSPEKVYSDGGYTPELASFLTSSVKLAPNDHCWLVHPTKNNVLIFARRLSEREEYLFVGLRIDLNYILPQRDNIFNTYSSMYIMLNDSDLYALKGEFDDTLYKKIISSIDKTSFRFGNRLIIINNMPDYPMRVLTVQSTKHLTAILYIFLAILILLYIITFLVCFKSVSRVLGFLSEELEKLNGKLKHGAEQIDELTAKLK